MTLNKKDLHDGVAWAVARVRHTGQMYGEKEDTGDVQVGEIGHNQGFWAEVGVPVERARNETEAVAGIPPDFCKTACCFAGDQVMLDPSLVLVVNQTRWDRTLSIANSNDEPFAYMDPDGVIDRPEGVTGKIIPVDDDVLNTAVRVEQAAQRSLGINDPEADTLFGASNDAEDLANIIVGIGLAHRDPIDLSDIDFPSEWDVSLGRAAHLMTRWMGPREIFEAFEDAGLDVEEIPDWLREVV
jgi:hypothetical protein